MHNVSRRRLVMASVNPLSSLSSIMKHNRIKHSLCCHVTLREDDFTFQIHSQNSSACMKDLCVNYLFCLHFILMSGKPFVGSVLWSLSAHVNYVSHLHLSKHLTAQQVALFSSLAKRGLKWSENYRCNLWSHGERLWYQSRQPAPPLKSLRDRYKTSNGFRRHFL